MDSHENKIRHKKGMFDAYHLLKGQKKGRIKWQKQPDFECIFILIV